MADRDPDSIKADIDQARDQLAVTVDSLAARANPHRIVHDLKVSVVAFVKRPPPRSPSPPPPIPAIPPKPKSPRPAPPTVPR